MYFEKTSNPNYDNFTNDLKGGQGERDSVCSAFTVNISDTVSTIYYTWMIA